MWSLYKSDVTSREAVPSLAAQSAAVRLLGSDFRRDVPDQMEEVVDKKDFQGMLTAKEAATPGIHNKLRVVPHVFTDGSKTMAMTND